MGHRFQATSNSRPHQKRKLACQQPRVHAGCLSSAISSSITPFDREVVMRLLSYAAPTKTFFGVSNGWKVTDKVRALADSDITITRYPVTGAM